MSDENNEKTPEAAAEPTPPQEVAAAASSADPAPAAQATEPVAVTETVAEAKTETAEFKGNRQAERALAALATLSAQRRFGALAELDGADFGFPSENVYISIERTSGGEPLRIELGSVTFGNAGRDVHFPREDRKSTRLNSRH